MKKIFTLIIAAFVVSSAAAQSRDYYDYNNYNRYNDYNEYNEYNKYGGFKEFRESLMAIEIPNELQVSVGFGSISDLLGGIALAFSDINFDDTPTYVMGNNYDKIPALNFSYGRQISPTINLSIVASYSEVSRDILLNSNQTEVGHKMFGSASIMPAVRFDWYRARGFRCYSKIGFGLSNYLDKVVYYNKSSQNISNSQWAPCCDIVPWGFAIGGRLYAFGEVSIGTIGMLKAGVGYRF